MATEKLLINQLQIRFNWKVAFVITLSLIALTKLGFWQLNRSALKRQMQTELNQYKSANPTPIESLAMQNQQNLNNQRVQLTGSYLNDKSIYISHKSYQGRSGYEVITPFKLNSTDQIVLVSRGWIALPYQQNLLPAITLIRGERNLYGTIHLPAKKSFFLEEKVQGRDWPVRLHHFDIQTITGLFQTPVIPYVVRLEPGNLGILQPFWPTVSFNSSQSTGYAIQWFMMVLALLVVTLIKSTNIVQLILSKHSHQSRAVKLKISRKQ